MNFCSDNVTGASPEILEALIRANAGTRPSYGEDDQTARVEAKPQPGAGRRHLDDAAALGQDERGRAEAPPRGSALQPARHRDDEDGDADQDQNPHGDDENLEALHAFGPV